LLHLVGYLSELKIGCLSRFS